MVTVCLFVLGVLLFVLFLWFVFDLGFPFVALTVIELALYTRLASNSEVCLPLSP